MLLPCGHLHHVTPTPARTHAHAHTAGFVVQGHTKPADNTPSASQGARLRVDGTLMGMNDGVMGGGPPHTNAAPDGSDQEARKKKTKGGGGGLWERGHFSLIYDSECLYWIVLPYVIIVVLYIYMHCG